MTTFRSVARFVLPGAVLLAGIASTGLAVADPPPADPNAVPPAMLNTQCSLDQIMAATKVVDPITYGEIIEKYNSEPRWVQGGIVYHMNLLLQKSPQDRQAEVDTLAGIFPEYVSLFTAAEPEANDIAAKCPTFPAEDPSVWDPNAPAPA